MSKKGANAVTDTFVQQNIDPESAWDRATSKGDDLGDAFSELDKNNKRKGALDAGAGDGPFDPDVAERAGSTGAGAAGGADAQFPTRAADLQSKAAAAGAQRSENRADLLGYVTPVKRRSASRTILG